jgi:hypothetical protein
MGKKLLVALTMEGRFAGEGFQSIDEDDDMLSATARELVKRNGTFGGPSVSNIKGCFRGVLTVTMAHPSKCRLLCSFLWRTAVYES